MKSLNPLTLSLQGTHLIEASAGTGKTYTIAALYVRLILGHEIEKALTPQNILVVTFTDAATEELRDRIRNRLSESAQYFRQQSETEDVFLVELRKSYNPEQWNMCAKRLEVAANYMDESAVFTIHSWCNKMLQQHAFDSGSPFKQDVNTDDIELLNNVIRDYWRIHFYGLEKSQCEFIIQNLAKSPDDFAGKIKGLLTETEALKLDDFQLEFSEIFKPWTEWSEKNTQFEVIAKQHWQKDFTLIKKLLEQAHVDSWLNATSYPSKKLESRLSEINRWIESKSSGETDTLAKFGITKLENGLKKNFKNRLPEFSFLAFQSTDELIKNTEKEPKDNLVKQIKLHAIKWIRNRYTEEKKKLSRVTFDDMLNNLDNALQGQNAARLGEVIRNQYPVALIDEFQDTDPIQYRIFSTLYQMQPSVSCFLIGDPKQAIYSFRGADIFTYLKAHQATQNHHTLKTNFRSTQALIDAINQFFSQAESKTQGAFRFNNAGNNPLPFVKVDAKGRKDNWIINNQNAPALTFWNWQEDKISMGNYREKMAKVTASELVKLLKTEQTGFQSESDFKRVELKDIAILVRNRNEAKIIRRELSKRQLKSVYLSEQDSIYDTDEAKDILMWLEAMANPRDERKVRKALSTSTFNFSKEKLHALVSDESEWEKHLDKFLSYQVRWQESGILPALRLLIHDYGLHLSLNDGNESERKLTNVLHLAELLQQSSGKIEGEEALIRHFAELMKSKNNRTGKDNIIRLESDANLIKIITIHKSKGLEYPLIFLPFVSDAKDITHKENFFKFHDEKGNLCIDLDTTDEGKARHIEELLQEDLRLLYVAITRAQYACWLGIASTNRLQKSAIGYLMGQNLANVKGECNSIEIVNLPEPTNDKFNSQECNLTMNSSVKTSTVYIPESWWVASYSALKVDYKKQRGVEVTEIETAQDDAQREDEETEFSLVESINNSDVYALPKGAKPGVLIHALLEKCGVYGFAQAHSDKDWSKKTVTEIFSDHLWDDEKRNVIYNALTKWLEMPLVENTRFMDLDKVDYKSELEFLIGAESVNVETLDSLITKETFNNEKRAALEKNQINGFLKGFMDLVFCHEGKYYVVDYKFNYLGNTAESYSETVIKKTMLEKRYDLQYALYLLALHRLLKIRLGSSYDYNQHIGGAIYLFLRGNTQIFDKPSQQFIENLDALFSGECHDR